MKRVIRLILFFVIFSFICINVNAKDIGIKVEDVKLIEKSSSVTVSDTNFSNDILTTDINFSEKNDYVVFEVELKNGSNKNYEIVDIIDNNELSNLDISYEFDKDLKSGEYNKFRVKVLYKEKLVNQDSLNISGLLITLNLKDDDGNTTEFKINNPTTGDGILHYLVLLIISLTGLYFLRKKVRIKISNKKIKVGSFVLLFALIVLPFCVFASEKYQINLKIKGITLESEYLDYEVSFNTNGGSEIEARSVTYGQAIGELPDGVKNGYTFNAWKDQYGNIVTSDTIVSEKLELVADFTAIKYDIIYNLNNGKVTSSDANPTKYTVEDEITLVNPTRKGYSFAGWSEGESEDKFTRVTIYHETGRKAFEAHWSKNQNTKYYVNHKYKNLDGTYVIEREELTGPTDDTVVVPFKEKYGFSNPEAQQVTISADEDSEVDYIYERVEYTLTVNEDVKTEFIKPKYPYETEITLTAKDKANYEFVGWSNGAITKIIKFKITEDTEVYPEYVSNLRTVTFNPNGGTVMETSRSVTKETAIGELPVPTAPVGKDFDAWYTELEGGTKVTASYIVNNNVTLYARYNNQTFTVSFDTDGGTIVDSQTIVYGSKVTKPSTNPSKQNYTFDDWYTDNEYTTKFDFENTTITSETTIYAKFNLNQYVVSFDTDGGTSVASQTVKHGLKATRPEMNPTKDGYQFVNWYTSNSYTELFDFDNIEIMNNTVIYAKFKEESFSTVFNQAGECTFNGENGVLTGDSCDYANGTNKYIDTGINLYNSENHDKDYEIGFTIVSYNPTAQVKQATFMNTKLEGDNYPGLVFRRRNSTDELDFSSRQISSSNTQLFFDYTTVETVKIYRIKNKETGIQEIFYSINGEDKIKTNNLSSFNPIFDLSVWFGAAPIDASATTSQRILVGTMKDMYIKLGTYHE